MTIEITEYTKSLFTWLAVVSVLVMLVVAWISDAYDRRREAVNRRKQLEWDKRLTDIRCRNEILNLSLQDRKQGIKESFSKS